MADPNVFNEREYDDEFDDSHPESDFPLEHSRYSLVFVISVPFMHNEDENAKQR